MKPQQILDFWFDELRPEQHYKKDPELDKHMSERFGETLKSAAAGEFQAWRSTANGALAEIILLDQFSRNIYRNRPEAFAQDPLAVCLSQHAIEKGFDQDADPQHKSYFYMPFMHSESKVIHEQTLHLFEQPGLEGTLKYEMAHKKIIDRFGRYPHRNEILGRISSPEEKEFFKEHGGF